jgi:hypothetical protein
MSYLGNALVVVVDDGGIEDDAQPVHREEADVAAQQEVHQAGSAFSSRSALILHHRRLPSEATSIECESSRVDAKRGRLIIFHAAASYSYSDASGSRCFFFVGGLRLGGS